MTILLVQENACAMVPSTSPSSPILRLIFLSLGCRFSPEADGDFGFVILIAEDFLELLFWI